VTLGVGRQVFKRLLMEIFKKGTANTIQGPEDWFTGAVSVELPSWEKGLSRLSAAVVSFAPGARTRWHTHPLGQLLYIVSGSGLAAGGDGVPKDIREGDLVWFPGGERHWHGGGKDSSMSHLAVQETLDGKSVVWLEEVSGEEYLAQKG
jgi:quercetin dioxygenase-like cupin family protein